MDCPLTLIVNLCILSRHYAQDRISYPRCTICNGAIFFLHIKNRRRMAYFFLLCTWHKTIPKEGAGRIH